METTFLAVALFGFCSTTIGPSRVCTTVEEISPRLPLLELCSPWAKSVAGKGWTYSNGRDRLGQEEKQKDQCDQVVERETGAPYDCGVREHCGNTTQETTRLIGMRVKAPTVEGAIARCVNLGDSVFLEALKSAAITGCFIAPAALPAAELH